VKGEGRARFAGVVALAIVALWPARASAEWNIKPFVGLTFGSDTTLVLEQEGGDPNLVYGVGVAFLGDTLGIEGEFGFAEGFFESGTQGLVSRSSVTTLTGNVVVTFPRRLTQYTLRPYVVGGLGVLRVRRDDVVSVFRLKSNLAAFDVGGGVTGFLTDEIGLSWDVRYFRALPGQDLGPGQSFGDARLSFWRVTMSVVLR
jgi:hypothetical protein